MSSKFIDQNSLGQRGFRPEEHLNDRGGTTRLWSVKEGKSVVLILWYQEIPWIFLN